MGDMTRTSRLSFYGLWLVGVAIMINLQPVTAQNGSSIAPYLALQKLDQRVTSVSYRLLKANAPFCDDQMWHLGWQLHDLENYGDKQSARKAYQLSDDYIGIAALAPNGPAAKAGLRIGDWIAEAEPVSGIADTSTKPGWRPFESAELTERFQRFFDANKALQIRHIVKGDTSEDSRRTITITPDRTCSSLFQIEPSKDRSAYTDGKLITVTSHIVDLARDDHELAAILAHEVAHNLLRHPEKLDALKIDRGILGAFGKDANRVKATEIEADQLSIWLMANAGFEPQGAIRFWTHYGKKYGKGIFSDSTHYRWRKRVELFEAEIAAIAQTKRDENGLLPPPLLLSGGAEIE